MFHFIPWVNCCRIPPSRICLWAFLVGAWFGCNISLHLDRSPFIWKGTWMDGHGRKEWSGWDYLIFAFSESWAPPSCYSEMHVLTGCSFSTFSWGYSHLEQSCGFLLISLLGCFPGGLVVENLPCNAGGTSSIPGQETKVPLAVECGHPPPNFFKLKMKSMCKSFLCSSVSPCAKLLFSIHLPRMWCIYSPFI